jgi:hypothetical protein
VFQITVVESVGYKVLATKCWLQSVGYKVLATKCWLQSVGYKDLATKKKAVGGAP